MKLRYLVICNKYGAKTAPSLQFWNEESCFWEYVDCIECKTDEEWDCNRSEEWPE